MNNKLLVALGSLSLLNYSSSNALSAIIYNVTDHCSCQGLANPSLVCTLDNSKQFVINYYGLSAYPFKQIGTSAPGEKVLVPLIPTNESYYSLIENGNSTDYYIASQLGGAGSTAHTLNFFAAVEQPVGYAVSDTRDGFTLSFVITTGAFDINTCEYKP